MHGMYAEGIWADVLPRETKRLTAQRVHWKFEARQRCELSQLGWDEPHSERSNTNFRGKFPGE